MTESEHTLENGNDEATQGMPQCIKVRDMWPSIGQRERDIGKHPAGKTGTNCIFY